MKRLLILSLTLLSLSAAAQERVTVKCSADEIVHLWDNSTAKYSNEITANELIKDNFKVYNTSSTELYIFKAPKDKATGYSVVIYPGGGYRYLSFPITFPEWLRENGITAVVVKYRLPNYGHKEAMLEDSAGAVRYLRTRTDLGIDPAKVGISGNSAGGHLAAWTSNIMADEEKPAFAVLHYPAIDRVSPYYIKSKENNTNILGADFTLQQATDISAQNMVSKTTPPTLIMLCDDDTVVPPTSPVAYYEALLRYGVKASIHIFPKGGHSLKKYTPERNTIITDWLNYLGLTNK